MTPELEVMKRVSWDGFMKAAGTPGVIDLVFKALTDAGFVIVSREPTKEMGEAVMHVLNTTKPPKAENGLVEGIRSIWEAMIDANVKARGQQ